MFYNDARKNRESKRRIIKADLIVAGGGLAGTCAAITAARAGIKVVLVQDRPVLGGNASSEVRLWALGATSHMGNNNRWAREGGVIDEILVENMYRNKEGNPIILDTVLLEKVTNESNIRLLLNTAVYDVKKENNRHIEYIKAFCSQNSTEYDLHGEVFCDATGDGIVSYLAGAAFRMGAEDKEEFGELLAPTHGFGELLGHSMYFYSKRAEKPVKFVPPSYALEDIKKIPKYKILNPEDDGCRLWWFEYGGRRDTVHDTEEIKWELWRVIYGAWNYIKNSGEFDNVDNLTLEWVGAIPGKRESRRFEGLYMLKQQDIVEQNEFEDNVSFGGWALDLHPADGIYSELPSCTQWHSKGVYQIPYRCFVSKDIDNLFFAGRIISASHVAFSSTRVMVTCAHGGQAVGMAAALCTQNGISPAGLFHDGWMPALQNSLNETGQSIVGIPISNKNSPMNEVLITASSTCKLAIIPFNGPWLRLDVGTGQLLPLKKGICYKFSIQVRAAKPTVLTVELRISKKKFNYTPDTTLEVLTISVKEGEQFIDLAFSASIPEEQYGFIILHKNAGVEIKQSEERYTGILSVFNGKNKAVSNNGYQQAPEHSGVENFEFWCPRRRPGGRNIAMEISPALEPYSPDFLKNGFTRPYMGTNAWVADPSDKDPTVTLQWDSPQKISSIALFFDTDFDHPMESSLMGHPENIIPFCVKKYQIYDETGRLTYEEDSNHQTINRTVLKTPVVTSLLRIKLKHPFPGIAASLFEIICQ